VKQCCNIGLGAGPSRVQEVHEGDSNKVANFIIKYCTEVLIAGGVSESFQHACSECRRTIEKALLHRDRFLLPTVVAVPRDLCSANRQLTLIPLPVMKLRTLKAFLMGQKDRALRTRRNAARNETWMSLL
jgi:hypothetical protein